MNAYVSSTSARVSASPLLSLKKINKKCGYRAVPNKPMVSVDVKPVGHRFVTAPHN